MKKFLTALFIMFLGLSTSAAEVFEFNQGTDYIFISENPVKSVMSNNPDIISAQRVMTYLGDDSQLLFTAKKIGDAKVQITTDKGVNEYVISIVKSGAKVNPTFMELDFPMGVQP